MSLIDREAIITGHESWDFYHLLTIASPPVAQQAHPGQFLMLRVSSSSPLLRRPFSLHHREKDKVEVFFKVVGQGTALLAKKKVGDTVDLLGPLGKGFTLPSEEEKAVCFLVGGGRGIAPLRFLAHELRRQGHQPIIFYGGKTKQDIPLQRVFEKEGFTLCLATEDGSCGYPGLITELLALELQKAKPTRLYVCGPEAMMRRIALLNRQPRIPAEYSLEARMGCGFGVCFGCVWKIRRHGEAEWTRICLEGPVFPEEVIDWPRNS